MWEIREHGFSLLHPRLPLFGPPWECPFEYPVFQTAAAIVDSLAPWTNLDVSIRVTNLLFFYLTAVMVFTLGRLLFREVEVALLAVGAFLFSPFNVFWSQTSMIEYTATFFGLAYLVWIIRWLRMPRLSLFVVALSVGVLGCLAKITTYAIPLSIALAVAGLHVFRRILPAFRASAGPTSESLDSRKLIARLQAAFPASYCLGLAALLAGPLLVGYLYTHFSDLIKEQSPYTAWLSSRHPYTRDWVYGSLAQRLKPLNWELIWHRVENSLMPWCSWAMILGFGTVPFRARFFADWISTNFLAGCSVVLAPLLGIFLFYNLYVVHTYYMIACAPFFALFAGVGLGFIFAALRTQFLRVVFVLLLVGLGLQEWSERFGIMLSTPTPTDMRVTALAEVARFIKKDEPVIVVSQTEYNSFVPYHLKRRAFMAMLIDKPVDIKPLLDQNFFKKNGFHWLLVEGNGTAISHMADRIKSRWKVAQPVNLPACAKSYYLYSLSDG